MLLHQVVSFGEDSAVTNKDCAHRDFTLCCSLHNRSYDLSMTSHRCYCTRLCQPRSYT